MLADDLLVGAKGAASYTGLTERQIYHMVYAGHLKPIRKGSRMYFRKSELDKAFSTDPPLRG